ncbi:MAG TPA: helix-turn-helix transcriptional regulator [Gammaproteobacteria bacterium]
MSLKASTFLYGLVIAAGALALRWLEYQYTVRLFSTQIYIVLIAVAFTALGLWLGRRLTEHAEPAAFEKNVQALEYLGISEREHAVLALLGEGHGNREIAARLFVSTNTIKTHLARLYAKLDVSSRTLAITKARSLRLLP